MKGVWGLDQVVLPLVGNILGFKRGFGDAVTLAFVSGDKIMGGLVFHNYDPDSGVIEVSAGSMSRGVPEVVFILTDAAWRKSKFSE